MISINTDAMEYTVTVKASNSVATGSVDFLLSVAANQAPTVDQGISDPADHQVPGSFLFTFATDAFLEADGEALTYLYTTSPSNSWLSFDSSTRTFSGTTSSNSHAGVFTVTVTAQDPHYPQTAETSTTFTITALQNDAPVLANPIADQTLTAHSALSFTVPANTFSEPESETITLGYSV